MCQHVMSIAMQCSCELWAILTHSMACYLFGTKLSSFSPKCDAPPRPQSKPPIFKSNSSLVGACVGSPNCLHSATTANHTHTLHLGRHRGRGLHSCKPTISRIPCHVCFGLTIKTHQEHSIGAQQGQHLKCRVEVSMKIVVDTRVR